MLRSYLCMLIGLVMLDSPANQSELLPTLAKMPEATALLLVALQDLADTRHDEEITVPAKSLAAALKQIVSA